MLFNAILILAVDCILLVAAYFGLGWFTHHNQYHVVPDLHGLTADEAARILQKQHLKFEVSDSIYDSKTPPGTIMEQTPKAGSKIKDNRFVYVTIRSYATKLIQMPAIVDMSLRQGMSILQGVGFTSVSVQRITAEYPDLIYGVRMNGLSIAAGDKVPVNAKITILAGDGLLQATDTLLPDTTAVSGEDIPTSENNTQSIYE